MHYAPEIGRFAHHSGPVPQYDNLRTNLSKVGIGIYTVVPFHTTDECKL